MKIQFSDDVDSKYRRPIEKLVRERRGAEEVDEPPPQSPCPYCEKDYDSYEVRFRSKEPIITLPFS